MERYLPYKYAEPIIWTVVLFMLFFWTPADNEPSLCLFRFAGFQYCPGCGIGHSIHYALHLNFSEAWQHHFAGIPATIVMLFKIFSFLIPSNNKITKNGFTTIPHDASGIATR